MRQSASLSEFLLPSTDENKEIVAHSILDMCRRLVSLLHVASRASEKHLGLSAAQLFVLQKLSDDQTRSLNELAQLTHTHQSSVSVVVKKLVEKKLVSSRSARDDARRMELKISPAGRKVVEGSPEPIQEQLIRSIRSLDISESLELQRLFSLVLDRIQESDQPPTLFFED